MCIGNTTSPAATNTNYIGWRDDQWERPEVITPTENENKQSTQPVKNKLKTPSKSQSSRTSGGTY